ncbi:MAG: hypothetical protein WA101_02270 [Minisyncoccia bacterium]
MKKIISFSLIILGLAFITKAQTEVIDLSGDGVKCFLNKVGRYYFADSITKKPINKKTYTQKPVSGYANGFAILQNDDGDMFFVKKNGTESPRFFHISPFSEGVAAVVEINGEGLAFHIDTNWVPIYKEKYELVGDYHKGFVVVQDSEVKKFFFIDKSGEPLRSSLNGDIIAFSKRPPDFDSNGVVTIENKKTVLKLIVKDDGEVKFTMAPTVKKELKNQN